MHTGLKTIDPAVSSAYRELFAEALVSADLTAIDAKLVKRTYRRMLFKNHPDRALLLGVKSSVLTERTMRLNGSYETLMAFVVRGSSRFIAPRHGSTAGGAQERRYRTIPVEPRRFGEFLLRKNIVTYRTLLHALAWQRNQRPYYGRLARDQGFLTDRDTAHIVKSLLHREKFGEAARRLGMMNDEQHRRIIALQRELEPKIGGFFVEHKIFCQEQLEKFLAEQREYNERQSSRRTRASAAAKR